MDEGERGTMGRQDRGKRGRGLGREAKNGKKPRSLRTWLSIRSVLDETNVIYALSGAETVPRRTVLVCWETASGGMLGRGSTIGSGEARERNVAAHDGKGEERRKELTEKI